MWRHIKGGGYDNGPNNPLQYYKDYYRAHRAAKVVCKVCGAPVSKQSLLRHMRTRGCRRVGEAVSLALAKATGEAREQD